MANLKVAILGFGTVGSSVAKILSEGSRGLVLSQIYNRSVERKKVSWVSRRVQWTDDVSQVLRGDADVVVEVAGGLDPAGDWVRKALSAGKSVVTANKKLIAQHGVELEALAKRKKVHLYYGAAVAGGIPVIPGVQQGLAGDRIEAIEGILNGTCNFILSRMEKGEDFLPVLTEAQRLGYAEADPTEDVAGYDARAKLTILVRLAMGAQVETKSIDCRPITTVAAVDFSYASELGCTIRQIARARRGESGLSATVGPMLVPRNSPLAWSSGTENMVVTTGRFGGKVVFSGHGAGGHPTAVAVVSDLMAIAHGSQAVSLPSAPEAVSVERTVPHYVRFVVRDRPGIVAQIAGGLAEQGININAILQKPGYQQDSLPFVVTTEPCGSSPLRKALTKISRMDFLLEAPLDMQIVPTE